MTDIRKYNFKALLAIGDVVAFVLGLLAAGWLRYWVNPAGVFTDAYAPWNEMFRVLPYALVTWVLALRFSGLYHLHPSPVDELVRLVRAVLITFLVLGAATFFYREFSFSRAVVLLMIPLVFSTTLLVRLAVRFLWHQVLRLEPVRGKALIVGTGPIALHLAEACGVPRCDFRLAGLIAAHDDEVADEVGGHPVVGRVRDLPRLLGQGGYQAVLVADGRLEHARHLEIAELCLRHGCHYHVVPDIFELMLNRVQVNLTGGIPLLGLKGSNLTGINYLLKRLFDLFSATVLLVLTAPVMLVAAVGIKLSSRGPVFFAQERVGIHGRTFRLLKFRSMHADTGEDDVRDYAQQWIRDQRPAAVEGGEKVFKNPKDPRIFRFGSFIRKYSIDELPQLFNVLRGDMSLIGPRPPIPYEVEAYRDWHRRRFEALPGITGLWQVSGRNRLSFDEMVKLDIEYIENWSFELDLRIALKTVGEVLSGGGY